MSNTYTNETYGVLPRSGSSAHFPPDSYELRLNQVAKTLDRMDEFSNPQVVAPKIYSAFTFEFVRPAVFPVGSTDPFSARIKVMDGLSLRALGYVWVTVDVNVWIMVDKMQAPVVYQGPKPPVGSTAKRESIVMLPSVERDYPNIRAMIQAVVAQSERTLLDEWARA